MNTQDDGDDEELGGFVVQLDIQESCQEAFLKSAVSLATPTDHNLRVRAAIQQGEVSALRRMLKHAAVFVQPDGRGWYPVHRAAAQPDPEVLETVLTLCPQGLSLEDRTSTGGETPLTLAVGAGLLQNVKLLLEHGAAPDNTNGRNESPLLLAVRAASYHMTHALVAHGAWVEQVCRKNWTATHEAARVGDADVLMLLLRNGGRVNHRDAGGATPLAVAAEHGHVDVTEILLNCGSRVNSQAFNGESVLLDAAGSGSTACIQLLLDNGADPNLPSSTGHLPVHKAAFVGHYDALKMLIPLTNKKSIKEAGRSPVHSAAEGGHAHCLRLLLAHGFDVNYRMSTRNSENYRDSRRSALYFAVSNGDLECTRILLAGGARTDLDPLCCLLVAVRSGRYDIVKQLLAAKADVNCYFTVVSDTVFPTALQYCLKDQVMMRLLLNNGYKFCDFLSLCCLVHLSGGVVRTLLDYVGHAHICSKLRRVLEKQREWPEILHKLSSPQPLVHLCRLEIRKRLTLKKLNKPEVMNSDLFPPRLRSFLLYEELDLYDPQHAV